MPSPKEIEHPPQTKKKERESGAPYHKHNSQSHEHIQHNTPSQHNNKKKYIKAPAQFKKLIHDKHAHMNK